MRLVLFPIPQGRQQQPLDPGGPRFSRNLVPLPWLSSAMLSPATRLPTPLWAWISLIAVLAGLWYVLWNPVALFLPADLIPAGQERVARATTTLRGAMAAARNPLMLLGGRASAYEAPWWTFIEVDGYVLPLPDQEIAFQAALAAAGFGLGDGDRILILARSGSQAAEVPPDASPASLFQRWTPDDLGLNPAVGAQATVRGWNRFLEPPASPPRPRFIVQRSIPFSLIDGGIGTTLSAAAGTVGEALRANGVVTYPEDRVSPDLSLPLVPGLHVRLERAHPMRVTLNDYVMSVRTHAPSVRDALAEMGVRLGLLDRVEPSPATAVRDAPRVRVIRVQEHDEYEQVMLPIESVTRTDSQLPKGLHRVEQTGQAGLLVRRLRVRIEDGAMVSRDVVEERLVTPPAAHVIAYGTRQHSGPMASLTVARALPGFHNTKQADSLGVRGVITAESTGYDAGPQSTGKMPGDPWYGITSTGLRAVYGIIAVDPRLIPYGTRLYVPGYGFGIAGDTGGAIVGHRVDLFYRTVSEAMRWGRRTVPVYILE